MPPLPANSMGVANLDIFTASIVRFEPLPFIPTPLSAPVSVELSILCPMPARIIPPSEIVAPLIVAFSELLVVSIAVANLLMAAVSIVTSLASIFSAVPLPEP